jgi:hypothetical protein
MNDMPLSSLTPLSGKTSFCDKDQGPATVEVAVPDTVRMLPIVALPLVCNVPAVWLSRPAPMPPVK